jgi:hypothetical protein
MRNLSVILAVAALSTLFAAPGIAQAQGTPAKGAPVNDEALRHFKAGVAILQDPEGARFEDAYSEFKRAYDLSHSPKILGNLGLCAMKLERDGESIDAYTRYLKEVDDIDPDERAQIVRDLQVLTTSAVVATITTRAGPATLVDTRLPVNGPVVTNYYDPTPPSTVLRLRPGRHAVVLRIDGKERARWEFNASAGERVSHELIAREEPLAPRETQRGGALPGAIVVTSIGVAALIAGGVLGAVTLNKVHALESQCPGNVCPSTAYPANVNAVHPFVQATDYTLLGGGVVTLAGAVWWLAAGLRRPAPAKVGTAPQFAAACATRECLATMSGRF